MSTPQYPRHPSYPPPLGPGQHPGAGRPQPDSAKVFGPVALGLGIVGALFALLPLLGFVAVGLGLVALVLGVVAIVGSGGHPVARRVVAIAGTVLGLVALVVGATGMVRVVGDIETYAAGLVGVGSAGVPAPAAPPPLPSTGAQPPAAPAPGGSPTESTGTLPGGFEWDNGVSVEVGAPFPVTFDSTACCPEGDFEGVAFEIRTVNASSETLTSFDLFQALTADGIPSEQVFDSRQDFGTTFEDLPPGAEKTDIVAFDASSGSLVLEISGLEYEAVYFTSTL